MRCTTTQGINGIKPPRQSMLWSERGKTGCRCRPSRASHGAGMVALAERTSAVPSGSGSHGDTPPPHSRAPQQRNLRPSKSAPRASSSSSGASSCAGMDHHPSVTSTSPASASITPARHSTMWRDAVSSFSSTPRRIDRRPSTSSVSYLGCGWRRAARVSDRTSPLERSARYRKHISSMTRGSVRHRPASSAGQRRSCDASFHTTHR